MTQAPGGARDCDRGHSRGSGRTGRPMFWRLYRVSPPKTLARED
jgi:hypothetical protein